MQYKISAKHKTMVLSSAIKIKSSARLLKVTIKIFVARGLNQSYRWIGLINPAIIYAPSKNIIREAGEVGKNGANYNHYI